MQQFRAAFSASLARGAVGVAISLSIMLATQAGVIDLTTLRPSYNNGSMFVPGVPPGWTNIQQTNLLSISNGSAQGDGPHNGLYLGNTDQVIATVQISTSTSAPYAGTFGGFFIDTNSGYFGVGIGTSGLAEAYGLNGGPNMYQTLAGYTGGPLYLELIRAGSQFEAEYSTNGSTYTPLYQQSGLTGTSNLDLTSYVGGPIDATINFTNLNATASLSTPEPATLPLVCSAFLAAFIIILLRTR